MNELLIGTAGSGKTTYCVERCLAALAGGDDPVALVPNYEEEIGLRRRLLERSGRQALFLPGIQRFQDLAQGVLDRGLPGWESRPPLARRVKLQELLTRIDLGPLRGSAETRGFIELLDRFLGEIDDGDLPPSRLHALARQVSDPGARERLTVLAEIHAGLRQDQDGGLLLDQRTVLRRACDLLEKDPTLVSVQGALLIIDGFSNFTPLQARFIEALLPVVGECCLALCLDPADLELPDPRPPFERLHRLALRYLNRPDWRVVPLTGAHRFRSPVLKHLAGGLFRTAASPPPPEGELFPDPVSPPPADGSLKLLQGATPADEVEGIVSRIRLQLVTGTSPDRVAVLYRDRKYGELLREVMEREQIPWQGMVAADLSRQPLTAVVSGLLRSVQPGGEPRLLELLRGGVVDTDEGQLARLERESREGRIPGCGGWREWFQRQRQQLNEEGERWDWLEWQSALPPLERPLDSRQWLELVLGPLLDLIRVNLSAGVAAAVSGERIHRDNLHFIKGDLQTLGSLERAGGELAAARDGGDLTLPEWNRLYLFQLEFEKGGTRRGREGGGVLLGNPFEMRLPELDSVFICGLNEGSFPPSIGEQPLLRENERELLTVAETGAGAIPGRGDRQAEERYLFYIAMTRAGERVHLSYSVEDGRGRKLSPSFFLEEVRTTLGDLPEPELFPLRTLRGKIENPPFARQLRQAVLMGDLDPRAETLAAEARAYLLAEQGDPVPPLSSPTDKEPPPALDPRLRAHLEQLDRFSPSKLEKYAGCPFHYLCHYILRLDPVEDGGDGPLEEGVLYHQVLQDLYSRPLDRLLPLRDQDEQLRRLLLELQEQAVAKLAREYPSLLAPGFALECSRRVDRLLAFIKWDLNRIHTTSLAPDPGALEREWELQYAPDQGAPFTVGGRIDRVDSNADGDLLVLDYKRTDPGGKFLGDVSELTTFQLDLYQAALTGEHGELLGSAYLPLDKIRLRGYFRESWRQVLAEFCIKNNDSWLDAETWSNRSTAVRERIFQCVADIREGRFPVTPVEDSTCKYCPFSRICRHGSRLLPHLDEGTRPGEAQDG